jgi:hypothetical protein
MYFIRHCARDNLRGQKSLGLLKMSLEMAQKVIVPQKKNYVPQFLKQRDINSFCSLPFMYNIFSLPKPVVSSANRMEKGCIKAA